MKLTSIFYCGRKLLAVSLLSVSTLSAAQDWQMAQLFSGWANLSEVKATYTETKTSLFLSTPIEVLGEVDYKSPDYIIKRTLEPVREDIEIDGDQLVITRYRESNKDFTREERQQYSISSNERLAKIEAIIRAFLSGDYSVLNNYFNAELAGDQDDWQLTLIPIEITEQSKIKEIRLSGENLKITSARWVDIDDEVVSMAIEYQVFQ